ncbi:uncharacterized protein ACB058_005162 [Synchiropus picturatus]
MSYSPRKNSVLPRNGPHKGQSQVTMWREMSLTVIRAEILKTSLTVLTVRRLTGLPQGGARHIGPKVECIPGGQPVKLTMSCHTDINFTSSAVTSSNVNSISQGKQTQSTQPHQTTFEAELSELNAQKTVEMVIDFRRVTVSLSPLMLAGLPIPILDSFCFLGTTITEDLKWEPTIRSLIRKAQQRMFFLRQLRKLRLPTKLLVEFYTAIIQSILTSSITVWYNSATSRDKSRLQRIIRSAEKVIGCSLPPLQDLYASRTQRCAGRIRADPSHPGHGLFVPLPSGRRLRSIQTRTSRHRNSFFPSAIRLLNL